MQNKDFVHLLKDRTQEWDKGYVNNISVDATRITAGAINAEKIYVTGGHGNGRIMNWTTHPHVSVHSNASGHGPGDIYERNPYTEELDPIFEGLELINIEENHDSNDSPVMVRTGTFTARAMQSLRSAWESTFRGRRDAE